MNKRNGHKRSGHGRKRTAKKAPKDKKVYRKGSKSKTMKGKKDFSTKKTSKVFNRRRHYQKHAKGSRVHRRPYAKKGGAFGPEEHQPSGTCNFARAHATAGVSSSMKKLGYSLYVPKQFW